MSKKLILGCDYDGTFRLSGDVRAEELEAARRFREAGNLVGIVTGRNVRETVMAVVPVCRDCCDFFICCTGGSCILPDGSFLFQNTVDGGALEGIFRVGTELGMVYMAIDVTGCPCEVSPLGSEDVLGDGNPETGRGEVYLSGCVGDKLFRYIIAPSHLSKFRAFNQCTVVFSDPEYAAEAANIMNERLACYGLITHNAYTSIDVTSAVTDKAAGLAEYARAVGVGLQNVIACGDGKNDAEMLAAYKSYAIESGDPAAIAAADGRTTPSVASLIDTLLEGK